MAALSYLKIHYDIDYVILIVRGKVMVKWQSNQAIAYKLGNRAI
jgi:hypothetical protein